MHPAEWIGTSNELCALAELRDRLRAGDIWVTGSRQYEISKRI